MKTRTKPFTSPDYLWAIVLEIENTDSGSDWTWPPVNSTAIHFTLLSLIAKSNSFSRLRKIYYFQPVAVNFDIELSHPPIVLCICGSEAAPWSSTNRRNVRSTNSLSSVLAIAKALELMRNYPTESWQLFLRLLTLVPQAPLKAQTAILALSLWELNAVSDKRAFSALLSETTDIPDHQEYWLSECLWES